ncbi:MAG: hypothetical protein ACT4TC_20780 [Myxococcaceae bacterium]
MKKILRAAALSAVLSGIAACGPGGGGSGTDAGSPGDGGMGTVGFMQACNQDSDCETNICLTYAGKGTKLCTRACTMADAATTCPPPSTGCNNMFRCKAP